MIVYQNFQFDGNSLKVVQKIANSLQLTLINGSDSHGNVCFAQNDEVRPEYKEVVTPIEILDYCYAIYHNTKLRKTTIDFKLLDFSQIPLPENNSKFWNLVSLGAKLRKLQTQVVTEHKNSTIYFPRTGDNKVINPNFQNSPPQEGCPKGGVEDAQDIDSSRQKPPYFIIKNHKIPHNTITRLPYNPRLKSRVKELRYAENLPEVLFWMQVHKSHFYKIDFDRQKIIGNYIVDFYVKKLGLVVEIDGSSHDGKEQYDAQRDTYLKSLGLKVLHIPAIEVLQMMAKVMTDVENFIIENYGEIPDSQNPPRPTGTPPEEGNKPKGFFGKVYINESQYFDNVPEQVWNLAFGTEQPAKKWLLDRKGTELTQNAILEYQILVFKLIEMTKIIEEIEEIVH